MLQASVRHFVDFYVMEAMRAGMSMAKAKDNSLSFRRSFDKLENDVNKAFDKFCETYAKRVRLYLWAAALGEARHADGLGLDYVLDGFGNCGRDEVFGNAPHFEPTQENIDTLKELFDQHWGGSYGGRAWLTIVEAVEMYGEVTDATFIDHAVDLEHNTGSVFNKTDGQYSPVNFDVHGNIRGFLNDKFRHDILKDFIEVREVSWKVYNLLQRYSNVVSKVNFHNYSLGLDWLDEFDVEYDDETLELTENDNTTCYRCRSTINQYDCYQDDNGHDICEYCFSEYYFVCDDCNETYYNGCLAECDGNDYCGECATNNGYTKCDWCDEYTENGETTQDNDEFYCQDCLEKHCTQCEDCGEWYYNEKNMVENNIGEFFCDDCKDSQEYCETCGKYFYDENDLAEHMTEEHKAQLPMDADGVFEYAWDTIDAMPKMETGEISISLLGGKKTVTTEVFKIGCFTIAYITEEMDKTSGWRIVHNNTGYQLGKERDDFMQEYHIVSEVLKNEIVKWDEVTIENWSNVSYETKQKVKAQLDGLGAY